MQQAHQARVQLPQRPSPWAGSDAEADVSAQRVPERYAPFAPASTRRGAASAPAASAADAAPAREQLREPLLLCVLWVSPAAVAAGGRVRLAARVDRRLPPECLTLTIGGAVRDFQVRSHVAAGLSSEPRQEEVQLVASAPRMYRRGPWAVQLHTDGMSSEAHSGAMLTARLPAPLARSPLPPKAEGAATFIGDSSALPTARLRVD